MKSFASLLFLSAVALVPANAAILNFDFTIDHCTGNCAPLTGTVTITDLAAGTVHVDVTGSGYQFVNTTSHGEDFLFNLINISSVTYSNFSAGWRANLGDALTTQSAGSNGGGGWSFDYYVTCDFTGGGCDGPGGSKPKSPPLAFDVTAAGLTTASFLKLGGGTTAYFAADVIGIQSGNTGLIGFTPGGFTDNSVPEPSSWLLLSSGIGFVGLLRRRRK